MTKHIHKKIDAPLAVAWLCDFGLCAWAEPTRHQMLLFAPPGHKPSPEAKLVGVRIVRTKDYLALVRAAKRRKP